MVSHISNTQKGSNFLGNAGQKPLKWKSINFSSWWASHWSNSKVDSHIYSVPIPWAYALDDELYAIIEKASLIHFNCSLTQWNAYNSHGSLSNNQDLIFPFLESDVFLYQNIDLYNSLEVMLKYWQIIKIFQNDISLWKKEILEAQTKQFWIYVNIIGRPQHHKGQFVIPADIDCYIINVR